MIAGWKRGPREFTYPRVERTFGLVARLHAKRPLDGSPSEELGEVLDVLLEASIEVLGEPVLGLDRRRLDRPRGSRATIDVCPPKLGKSSPPPTFQ